MPAPFPSSAPLLLLDTASPRIAAGLLIEPGEQVLWECSEREAGIGLFTLVEALLRARNLPFECLQSIVFCEGPGSLLGIRLTAVALRTWTMLPRPRPLTVWAYRSLELVAADLLEQGRRPPFLVVTDARRQTWNALRVESGGASPAAAFTFERWPAGRPFPDGLPLLAPEGFPHWQPLPAGVEFVPYRPERLPALLAHPGLLHPAAEPDAFLIEMPTYRTWQPSPLPCSGEPDRRATPPP